MRYRLLSLIIVLAALMWALGALGASAQGEYRLTVLHSAENHGHWEPFTQTVSLGGIARRATLVQRVRAEGGNLLLLDSGDVSQGTLYFSQHRMAEGAAFYNALGYDAVAIGNHEFDLGPRLFAQNWLANARFAVPGTNLDFAADADLAGKVPATVLKTLGGESIGILGFTTEDIAFNTSMGSAIRVKPRVDAARAAVAALSAQGVNKIIALSHLGYREDQKLATSVDGIDVIVGGHTPTLLGDPSTLDRVVGVPEGPYPTVARAPGGAPVLIVFAGEWGKVLGRLDMTFDAAGIVTRWSGGPLVVDARLPEDPAVAELLRQFAAPLGAFRRAVAGKSASDLDGSARLLRSQEAPLGNLVADAMLEMARGDGAQIALINGGGIRAGLKAGDISVADVLEVLPFGNRLVQMDLNGADLLAALENGLSRISERAGRFPQVAGLRFAFDSGRSPGTRVTAVQLGTAAGSYRPLDPRAVYRIVTSDFMANGGDGYDSLKLGVNVRGGDVPLDDALLDYLRAHGSVDPQVEGRIVGGALPAILPAAQTTAAPNAPPATAIPPPSTPQAMPVSSAPEDEIGVGQVVALGLVLVLALGSIVATLIRARRKRQA